MSCSKKEIGDRIIALRTARGLSQLELAKGLHVSREVVAKWETGTRDLKTEHSVALADYFGVTCDEILRGVKSENVATEKRLGLCDKAIEILALINSETYGYLNEYVNDFICHNEFGRLITELANASILLIDIVLDSNKTDEGRNKLYDKEIQRVREIVGPNLAHYVQSPYIKRDYYKLMLFELAKNIINDCIVSPSSDHLQRLQKYNQSLEQWEANQNGKRSKS